MKFGPLVDINLTRNKIAITRNKKDNTRNREENTRNKIDNIRYIKVYNIVDNTDSQNKEFNLLLIPNVKIVE